MGSDRSRYFNPFWFQEFPWLKYHRGKRAAFCSLCSDHYPDADKSPLIFTESASGIRKWKRVREKLKDHGISSIHAQSMAIAKKLQLSANMEHEKKQMELQKQRREGLTAYLDTIKTLLRQGLPIRGHTDEESNLYQLNKDKEKHCAGLKLIRSENKYMTHEILDHLENLVVLSGRKKLVRQIKTAKFYSIICDESTDMSKIEQMSFSVRYCTDDYDIHEDFIGMMPCDEGVTSKSLLKYVKDILLRCEFQNDKLIGMAFDGASAMKLLAKLVKEDINPNALYFHCMAHINELVFKDATSQSPLISGAQDLCEDIYVLIGVSPKRIQMLKDIYVSKEDNGGFQNIKNLSRTRWTTRGPAATVIINQHAAITSVIEELGKDKTVTPECRARCRGLMSKLKNVTVIFDLMVMQDIALVLEHNSKSLQAKQLTAEEAQTSLCLIKEFLNSKRTNTAFENLIKATSDATGFMIPDKDEPEMKRARKTPSNLEDFVCSTRLSNSHTTESGNLRDQLRVRYFEAIDAVLVALETRFGESDFGYLQNLETMLLNAINGTDGVVIPNSIEFLNLKSLKTELDCLPAYLKVYNADQPISIKKSYESQHHM